MNEAYRDTPVVCPACSVPMEKRLARDAEVDICTKCHGLWIDWFDGDTWTVASDALPISDRPPVALPESASCSRCHGTLRTARHQKTGPVVLRCADCYGTFVPRESLEQLLDCPPDSKAEARESFVVRLRRALGI